ncbi:pseudouridine synthase [Phenylobacterium sp.]|uniref:pseudouridine synthase n=1 Tax=Phenylobacterium sp. TaxID=1871053 RepID=UPI002731F459|nr:pseudouridine synthase [Phenylobacterium sp.]MDP2214130.1 pseudouridine synthase [Phenylobacterium sp.]
MVHERQRTPRPPSGQAPDAHDPTAPDGAEGGGERVAKALARAGVASRREVERLIEAGRVALNGQVLTTPAVKVEANDILTVDGEVVDDREPARLFRYHKPAGLVTTHSDPAGRSTVFETLPEGLPRLISVGRLDLNTEGLLLLTNDGALARSLELPATGLQRRYRARAHGRITQDKLDALKDGVTVEGVRYGPIEARIDKAREGAKGANVWISLTLTEGKNREVRRVLESLGLQVNRLIRLSYGPLALGVLEAGEIEEVGPRVLREQFAGFISPEDMPKGDRPAYSPPKRNRAAGAARRAAAEVERVVVKPVEKKAYKPGWAKAKITVRPKGAPKAKPAPKVSGRDAALAEGRVMINKARVQAARSAAASAERAERPEPVRTERSERPRPERPKAEAPRSGRPERTQADRPRPARSAPERTGGDRPRPERGKPAGSSRSDGPRSDGHRADRSKAAAPRSQAPKTERPAADRPRTAGPGAPRSRAAPGKAKPGGKPTSDRKPSGGGKGERPAGPARGGPRPGGPARGSGGPRGPKSRG